MSTTDRARQYQAVADELAELHREQQMLYQKLRDATRRFQALCDHQWRFYPVAGEGRYCSKCNLDDPECDD